jgi:hypothetical protein
MKEPMPESAAALRPAQVCAQLLLALDASDGRRARRKRNTTPDAVGQGIKRGLLEQAITADPDPAEFDAWLFAQCRATGAASGPMLAMARDILAEWRDALAVPAFRTWLAAGAPSDDRRHESRRLKGP